MQSHAEGFIDWRHVPSHPEAYHFLVLQMTALLTHGHPLPTANHPAQEKQLP